MALGTNYARSPSAKQEEQHWINCAKHEIKKGTTKDEFLLSFKDFARPKQSEIWDKAIKLLKK